MPNSNEAIHVMTSGDEWIVRREDQTEPLSTHGTQEEAAEAGRAVAREDEVEFMLHGAERFLRTSSLVGDDGERRSRLRDLVQNAGWSWSDVDGTPSSSRR